LPTYNAALGQRENFGRAGLHGGDQGTWAAEDRVLATVPYPAKENFLEADRKRVFSTPPILQLDCASQLLISSFQTYCNVNYRARKAQDGKKKARFATGVRPRKWHE
jgi:hypothetical protein